MKQLLTVFAAVMALHCLFPGDSSAQGKYLWKEGKSGSYVYRFVANDPMKARLYTLENGLTVMLSQNNKEPRIKSLIGVRAGSNNDPADHTGLAHYLEHLLFKGTYRYGSLDSTKEKPYIEKIESLYAEYNNTTDNEKRRLIYRQIDSVSGIAAGYAIANEYQNLMTAIGSEGTNAHTWVEETVYEEDIPSNMLDKFLAVQSERFRNPVFRLFHTELEAVYEEKNRGLDNDGTQVWEAMLKSMFPRHNYGQQTTIGTIPHLKNPSLKAIREFYETYYVPGNMVIVMSGDFDPDEVIGKIDRAFSFMKAKPVKLYQGPVEDPITEPIVQEVVGPDAEFIQLGFRIPGVSDYRSVVVATVANQLLSNGKAGLIDINLNKQQKLLGASAGIQYWKDYSLFVLSGKARDGQSLDEVKELLLSQVERLATGQFDEQLIRAIVSNFKLYEISGLESNESRAQSMMNAFIQHRGEAWDKDVAFISQMATVTKKEVIDFVNAYLAGKYVAVYKRKGERKEMEKVEKPPITPLTLNRDVQSDFVKQVEQMPAQPLQPKWLDFEKEIGRGRSGNTEVLYVQNKDNDLFTLYYRFEMGAWNDRELGLAAGYLQYLGDDRHSAEEISRKFYNIACSFSVNPGSDNTVIQISGLRENFDQAVKLFENLIRNCRPDEKALESLKARIMKSREDSKLNKNAIASGMRNYAMYGPKNPFNYQLSAEELKTITAEKLVSILHDLFSYEHRILYFGPLPLNALTAAMKKLHATPAVFRQPSPAVEFSKNEMTSNQVLFTPYEMVQSEITWINNSDRYDAEKTPVIELFNNYFGGGMSSVVFQTIRESKALAYQTYAYYSSPSKKEDRYTMMAYVGSQADKMNEAVSAMNELLTELPQTEDAIRAAKESIRKSIASQRVTDDAIMVSYLTAKKFGIEGDIRKVVYEKMSSLTFDDLRKFYTQSVKGRPYTYCVLASPAKINMDDLKKIGAVKQLSLEEIFGY